MRVDELTVALRPRSMSEAADLGALLVHRHARSVWGTYWPVHLAAVLLAACGFWLGPWVPTAILLCLKPWLDRSLMFVLSRAVFGQSTGWRDLWRQRVPVWCGQWFVTFFWRRLSPWRAYTLAVEQLEGQRGGARSRRVAQLLRGRRGAAFGLQFVFANVESALMMAVLSMALWWGPLDSFQDMKTWFASSATLTDGVGFALYAAIVFIVEPFYVGAGFTMYLNRRVELEAWDIEQEFRHAF